MVTEWAQITNAEVRQKDNGIYVLGVTFSNYWTNDYYEFELKAGSKDARRAYIFMEILGAITEQEIKNKEVTVIKERRYGKIIAVGNKQETAFLRLAKDSEAIILRKEQIAD